MTTSSSAADALRPRAKSPSMRTLRVAYAGLRLDSAIAQYAPGASWTLERHGSRWRGALRRQDGSPRITLTGATRVATLHQLEQAVHSWYRGFVPTERECEALLDELQPGACAWDIDGHGGGWTARASSRWWPEPQRKPGGSRHAAQLALVRFLSQRRMMHWSSVGYWDHQIEPHVRSSEVSRWWGPEHDALIPLAITEYEWFWQPGMFERVVAVTDPAVLERWRQDYDGAESWYNHINRFAAYRAQQLGLLRTIRLPIMRRCALCGAPFHEASIPASKAFCLGMDHLVACDICATFPMWSDGRDDLSRRSVVLYARRLAEVTGGIPPQVRGRASSFIRDTPSVDRADLLKVLVFRPTPSHVRELFGSWLHVLLEAGVLSKDGLHETARGTRSIASDGHVCLSFGERTIEEVLIEASIPHDREAEYPDGRHRSDFTIGSTFVEFAGMAGDLEYEERLGRKLAMAREHGMEVVTLHPRELLDRSRLRRRLEVLAH